MRTIKIIKTGDHNKRLTVYRLLVYSLFLVLFSPGALLGAEIPSVEDVCAGKAKLPTIGDLTDGKVKIGDLVDKHNVDLVKDYLSVGLYELVKRGMVMRMGTQLPPDQLNPKVFRKATERNRGKAVMNEGGAVYYEKIGTPWPGGVPYPSVKNGQEAIANHYYGSAWDSYHTFAVLWYINSKGVVYKTAQTDVSQIRCNTRISEPPLGTNPGYENTLLIRLSALTYPLEVKGLGQLNIRYYDSAKNYDAGFAYLPAFKRTIRVSATTWQDNLAGSDLINGDSNGFLEPSSDWTFKLLGKKFLLVHEPKSPSPIFDDDERGYHSHPSKNLQFDVGKRFPRFGWVIMPVDVVEAIAKFKHVYGKRVLYISSWPYTYSGTSIQQVDIYDRQMKMWKMLLLTNGCQQYVNGEPQTPISGSWMWDIQVGHATMQWMRQVLNPGNMHAERLNLTALLKMGR